MTVTYPSAHLAAGAYRSTSYMLGRCDWCGSPSRTLVAVAVLYAPPDLQRWCAQCRLERGVTA